jgi:hypothetical protein
MAPEVVGPLREDGLVLGHGPRPDPEGKLGNEFLARYVLD